MRQVVRGLAYRTKVCVVSGRDRVVVQRLMGVADLVVAGSNGFDIWSPEGGEIEREEGVEFADLIQRVTDSLREEAVPNGTRVEPKRSSVALHYRLVAETERPQVKTLVERVMAANPDALKMTPGKMVFEIQPKVDWDKGKAVLYLLEALKLDRADLVPLYLGDDITDEDAFRALAGRGIGIVVADPADRDVAGRSTAARYFLRNTEEVQTLLDRLAR